MYRPRIIPVLLLKNGILVRSRNFSLHQLTGNHLYQTDRYSQWKADEIIYLDISRDNVYDISKGASTISSTSSNMDETNELNKYRLENDFKTNMIEIIKTISKNHSYDCPSISAFPIEKMHTEFQKWIVNQTKII